MFDRETPETSLDAIMDYEDACLQEEAERMPETAGYYYLVNLDESTVVGKKWIEKLRLRMNTLDARDIQREYWDISVLEHILEKAPFLKMYTSFLPKEKYDKNSMPELCEKGLETLERYLEKCFIEDQCSRMGRKYGNQHGQHVADSESRVHGVNPFHGNSFPPVSKFQQVF